MIHAFTLRLKGKADRLQTDCGVCKYYDESKEKRPQVKQFTALWDTGASRSVITNRVAVELGLAPIGLQKVCHAAGESIVNAYLIGIVLPNNVSFENLRVTEGNLSEIDILIGMDIISTGDFSICQKDGNTVFSFQCPSTHEIDFVKEFNNKYHTPAMKEQMPGRNDLCPCGSGKKYKYCHGA